MTKKDSANNVYKTRRKRIFDRLNSNSDLVLILSAPERLRSADSEFLYRADSNLYYLSGFAEPQSALLLWKEKNKTKTVLFARPSDPVKEHWNGRRLGIKKATKTLGVDEAYDIKDLYEYISEWLRNVPGGKQPRLYTNAFTHKENLTSVTNFLTSFVPNPRRKILGFDGLISTDKWLHADRTIKDAHEIKLMRESSRLNVESHVELLKAISHMKNECEVQAKIESEFKKRGCNGPAYPSICASGANATILHYNENNAPIKPGDLVLIDAGCEYELYASDITRTYPVSGKFTKEQKIIFDIVSEALIACINIVKPGIKHADIHLKAQKVLTKGLIKAGILKGTVAENMKNKKHLKYFTHGTSHHMGLDVHDENLYVEGENAAPIKLKPGMVFTVEPGLYFQPGDKSVNKKWWGIAVRLEDDILVTKSGFENLTPNLPRTSKEVEDFMEKASSLS